MFPSLQAIPKAMYRDTTWFRYSCFRFYYPIRSKHLHVTKTVTAILAFFGDVVGMGDARWGGKKLSWGAVWDIFRLGGDNGSVNLVVLFHLLVSSMHQVYTKLLDRRKTSAAAVVLLSASQKTISVVICTQTAHRLFSSDGCPSGRFFHVNRGSGAQPEWPSGLWLPLLPRSVSLNW